jgi:hypothetical protein
VSLGRIAGVVRSVWLVARTAVAELLSYPGVYRGSLEDCAMPIGLLFWILMIMWLLAYAGVGWWGWGGTRGPYLTSIFLWFLLFLLGWKEFGFILQGGGMH